MIPHLLSRTSFIKQNIQGLISPGSNYVRQNPQLQIMVHGCIADYISQRWKQSFLIPYNNWVWKDRDFINVLNRSTNSFHRWANY